MKVNLAVQVLSHSVASGIRVLESLKVDGFEDVEATAQFIDVRRR